MNDDEAQTPGIDRSDQFVDSSPDSWNNTTSEKMWGLMQIWGTVKYNFVFLDRRPRLDWDAAVRSAIPRVLEEGDREVLGALISMNHNLKLLLQYLHRCLN